VVEKVLGSNVDEVMGDFVVFQDMVGLKVDEMMRDSVVFEDVLGSMVDVDAITSVAIATLVVSAKISEIISLIFSVVVVARVEEAFVRI